jgi:CelD/BcsL family acetyltransferase involved in cellulose biosynthesis
MLSAHVLRLDGRPLAYILGVAAGDGAFLDLKESFDASYAQYSPGHVLKRFAMETLIARGVGIYDFMRACEPYKLLVGSAMTARWRRIAARRAPSAACANYSEPLKLRLYSASVRRRYPAI